MIISLDYALGVMEAIANEYAKNDQIPQAFGIGILSRAAKLASKFDQLPSEKQQLVNSRLGLWLYPSTCLAAALLMFIIKSGGKEKDVTEALYAIGMSYLNMAAEINARGLDNLLEDWGWIKKKQ